MKAMFQNMLTGIKITKTEKDIILTANKIFDDIFGTLEKTSYLDDRMAELYSELEGLDLEYLLNNFPIEVEGEE